MKLAFHFNRPLAQFPRSELSISNGNAALRAESVGFDLAADFLAHGNFR
jgi:hypothetical protein